MPPEDPVLQAIADNFQGMLDGINSGSGKEASVALWKAHRVVIAVSCCLAALLLTALQELAAASCLHMELYACLSV